MFTTKPILGVLFLLSLTTFSTTAFADGDETLGESYSETIQGGGIIHAGVGPC